MLHIRGQSVLQWNENCIYKLDTGAWEQALFRGIWVQWLIIGKNIFLCSSPLNVRDFKILLNFLLNQKWAMEVRGSLLILGCHVSSFCVQIMKCCAAAWLLWNAGKGNGKGILVALRIYQLMEKAKNQEGIQKLQMFVQCHIHRLTEWQISGERNCWGRTRRRQSDDWKPAALFWRGSFDFSNFITFYMWSSISAWSLQSSSSRDHGTVFVNIPTQWDQEARGFLDNSQANVTYAHALQV